MCDETLMRLVDLDPKVEVSSDHVKGFGMPSQFAACLRMWDGTQNADQTSWRLWTKG